jgi:hypothetical protein
MGASRLLHIPEKKWNYVYEDVIAASVISTDLDGTGEIKKELHITALNKQVGINAPISYNWKEGTCLIHTDIAISGLKQVKTDAEISKNIGTKSEHDNLIEEIKIIMEVP